ncbi:hypothetical protein, partial [Acidiphilium rubrum]|uniref:hypothetical protein n=1 Tax=Acidiphilium rubrum TaxID=526 RepID=UPI002B5B2473
MRLSEFRLVAGIADGVGCGTGALAALFIHQLATVKEPDGVAQIGDQLVHRECQGNRISKHAEQSGEVFVI